MKRRLILSALFLFVLSFSLVSAIKVWPTYQNDQGNNGLVNFAGPDTTQLKCVSGPLNHYLTSSSPVVGGDGTIYLGTFSKNLYALYSNCSIQWVFDDPLVTNAAFRTPVLGEDGVIYAANGGTLFAVNPNGTKKWAYAPELDFSFVFSGEPKFRDNAIWIGGTYQLLGINSDGTLKCTFISEGNSPSSGPSVVSTPSFDENSIYITDLNSLYKLDLNCNKIWKVELDRAYQHIPAVVGDKIYVSNYKTLFTFDKNGNRLGGFEMGGTELVTIRNDLIYMGVDNKFWIFNSDGSNKCEYSAPKRFVEAPVVDSEGRAYLGNKDGNLYAFDQDCQLIWKYAAGRGIERAVAFGQLQELIVPSGDSKVYLFSAPAEPEEPAFVPVVSMDVSPIGIPPDNGASEILKLPGEDFFMVYDDNEDEQGTAMAVSSRSSQRLRQLDSADLSRTAGLYILPMEKMLKGSEMNESTASENEQLARMDLQNQLAYVEETFKILSTASKAAHATALAVINNLG